METENKENKAKFVHLHVHSHYSLLDGMATIPGLVDKAKADGMSALALTDHGSMFGIKEFYNYVKKVNKGKSDGEKFKPIIGVEAYCARRTHLDREPNNKEDRGGWHLVLLAKNKTGYVNLCRLVSKSWVDGFYYKPRIDKALLEKYREGLIVSSACLGGEIPQKLMGGNARNVDDDSVADANDAVSGKTEIVTESNMKNAEEAVLWFKNLFGDDYYLEIQRHKTDKEGADYETYERQKEVNAAIMKLAEKTGVKVIATNDVHFVEEEHADAHDRLICLATSKDLNDPKRMRYTKQEWLKTQAEMGKIFADLPEVMANTLEIAGKVEFYEIDSPAMMPMYEIPKDFGTEEEYAARYSEADLRAEFGEERFEKLGGYNKVLRVKLESDYLAKLTYRGAEMRYESPLAPDIQERIDYELDVMKTMGFPGYFLIVQDFISAAREMGVSVGPGRGSAAGSVVAYCLKITDIDPLKYDLLFERFLNPDRISMPDIDIDFDDDGRGKVLNWVTEKYGKERVAHIVTYGTMAAKSSIKDVARVQKLPLSESDRLSKLVPDKFPEGKDGKAPKVTLTNCYNMVDEFKKELHSPDENVKTTLKYAQMLEGTVRQTGVHACGVIIGSEDLTNLVPISTAIDKESGEEVMVTQYEGAVIEEIGLIKMDFLGLKTLSIINEAISNIKKTKGIDLDISAIPIDDRKTYELFSAGKTTGTFQFESAGMQQRLRELKPTQFEDLIAMNALYRPGPMNYIPSFIRRKQGEEPIEYDFPIMEKRLKDTYGITVYQEQVMLLSRDLAGFTRGQSDELRKAMGKKLLDKMAALKTKFLDGAKNNGYGPEEKLEKIWNDWAEFAKYAFNKSHATCYSWVAYQTAYLKAHYPAEFMAANLTRNKDNISEVAKFMDECRSMGINVLEPDVNESDLTFTVNKQGNIRFGLGGIKGIGESAVEAIVNERRENGPFTSIFNFVERVNLNACKKNNIEALAASGAFDNFPETCREHFFHKNVKDESFVDVLIRYGNKYQEDKNSSAVSLFGGFDDLAISRPELPKITLWSNIERLNREKELVGIYISSHPLDDYYVVLNYACTKLADFDTVKSQNNLGREIVVGGIITGVRKGVSKAGKDYAIIKVEDFSGSGEIALFGKDYETFKDCGAAGDYIMVRGRVQYREYSKEPQIEFKIQSIDPLQKAAKGMVKKLTVQIPLEKITEELIAGLSALMKNNMGSCSLYFKIIEEADRDLFVSLSSGVSNIVVDNKLVHFLEDNSLEFTIN
ncbi:MAG: DNA polymerase III subunit alpha [Dysgonamonadaceae bacterium]|nr:DNA polymerase III subunit alpha [Dysgonamonadaceae bacterium]